MLDVYRKELKYLIDPMEMVRMKSVLDKIMSSDSHNGVNGYRVRSLYFDTLLDSDFEEKLAGYDSRQKIRIRVYDGNSQVYKLELKAKEKDMQRKISLLLSREETESMMRADYSFLLDRPEKPASSLYIKLIMHSYRPKCIVEYDRYAYIRNTNNIRITFDMNLRATESNLNLLDENLILYPVCRPGEITMEVKYDKFLFSFIKNAIKQIDRTQISNSKYCKARKISKKGRI